MSGLQDNPSEDDRLLRLQTALELVWHIHLREKMHLGLERSNGVQQHCIPCICAAALGRGMDSDCVDTQELVEILNALKEDCGHAR